MQERIDHRRDFELGFMGWLFYGKLMAVCCSCMKRLCFRCLCCKSRFYKYKKFRLAVERLRFEHDIQGIIAQNRVAHLVHKTYFLHRQRQAVNLARMFVISDRDIEK